MQQKEIFEKKVVEKKLFSKLNCIDAIIIGHSQFEKIPMSIERQKMNIENEIEEITNGISSLSKQWRKIYNQTVRKNQERVKSKTRKTE